MKEEHVCPGIHTPTHTHVHTHVHGGRTRGLITRLSPDMHSHSHSEAHADTLTLKLLALRAGGGAGALQAQRHSSSARPVGPAADARGYFKPGSMGDFW